MPVDTLYSELCQNYPEFFSDEIAHPADQLERISDVLDSLRPIYENPYSNNLGEAANTLALDLLERGANVSAAKPTIADRFAENLQKEQRGNQMLMQDNERQERRIAYLQQNRERVQAELDAEKKKRADDIEALKEHNKERDRKRRENKTERLQREKLFKVAQRVDKMKTTPQNRAKIDELIGTIDLLGIGIREGTKINLGELREVINEQKERDPDWEISPRIEAMLTWLDNKQISEMDIHDVSNLTDILLNLENEIRTQNKTIATQDKRNVYAQAEAAANSVRQAKAPTDSASKKNGYLSLMLSPERFVRRLVGYDESSPLYTLTKDLSDGQRKAQRFEMESERYFDKWHSNKKFMERLTGKKAERIKIHGLIADGNKLVDVETEITPAQLVSLHLHSRHYANRAHMLGGGITIPNADLYAKGKIKEAFDKGVSFRLDENGLREINRKMTPELMEYANVVSNYLNGMCKDAINEASVQLDGYEKAKVQDYFPIKTDPDFVRNEQDDLKFDLTIEGWGNLKERSNGNNPILLEDVTDVLERHKTSTARYAGLAIPARNFRKLLNVTGQEHKWSLKKTIKAKWGSSAMQYLDDMLADVHNARKGQQDGLGRLIASLRSKNAGAVLTLNTSVIIKQAASYPTAAGVLGWKPLLKALNPQAFTVDMYVIARYTPDYWYRRKGYSTTELGDITSRKKGLPKALNLIQGVDLATTRTLWLASEYYVRDQIKGKTDAPRVRSDAYYEQVAEVYNRVIEETQPNYSPMQRPAILRTQNELTKSLVMFKTQSFQNFNMLYDTSSIADMALGGAEDFSAVDAVVGGGTWYDVEAGGVSGINDAVSRFSSVVKAWQSLSEVYGDKDKELTPAEWLAVGRANWVLAKTASESFGGIPVGNLEKIVQAVTGCVAKRGLGDENGTLTLRLLNWLGYNDEKNSTKKELRDKADSEENSEIGKLFQVAYEAPRDADGARREKQDYQDTQSDIYTAAAEQGVPDARPGAP